jgi:membrane protein
LRTSLNTIWDVPPTKKKKFLNYLLGRLFSFGMLICLAFLLLVSLIIQAGLAAFSSYLGNLLPTISKILLASLEFVLSFGLSVLLFAFIYKFMSDVKIKFRIVWPGAIFTAALFAIGKYLIGLYISQSHIANTYGAASSLIVLLLWIFYSSQIVFFGAEFTRALALHRGIKLVPGKNGEEK